MATKAIDADALQTLAAQMSARIEDVQQAAINTQTSQDEFIRQAEAAEHEYEDQKNTLGNLASLGILAAVFGHETVGSLRKSLEISVCCVRTYMHCFLPSCDVKTMRY